uniref:Uncharacterized protein n=1 Tax=Zea mays TaxID=4577 RepID=C4J845_MAIZE|nr:unknown [Zea mays]
MLFTGTTGGTTASVFFTFSNKSLLAGTLTGGHPLARMALPFGRLDPAAFFSLLHVFSFVMALVSLFADFAGRTTLEVDTFSKLSTEKFRVPNWISVRSHSLLTLLFGLLRG